MKRLAYYPKSTRRRGVVAVLVGITLITLLLFASLAIDVGYICALTAEMQNNADAGAMAGASALREGDYAGYHDRALQIIALNQQPQGYLSLDDQVVEVGTWDKALLTFTALDPANAASANAVRVVGWRHDAPLFFAAIIGKTSTDVSRSAVALVTPSCNGLWGLNQITIPGSVMIDSYDSTDGAYSAGTAQQNGDVCSNGDIRVQGSADIYGDVLGNTVTEIGGALTISGIVEETVDTIDAPPVDFGDVATNNDNATIPLTDNGSAAFNPAEKKLRIPAGDNLTLAAGTYYFTSIVFNAPSTLTLTGPVVFYLAGNFDASSSGILNTTQNPADLTIYSTGTTINMSGGVSFYGSIYAPNATISLSGNTDYYGALVGGTVDFKGNFSFHVDESLQLVDTLKGPVILVK